MFLSREVSWEYSGVEDPPCLLVNRTYNLDCSEYGAGGFKDEPADAAQLSYARILYHNRGIVFTDFGYPQPHEPVERAAAAIMHAVVQTELMYGPGDLLIDERALQRDGPALGPLVQEWGFRPLPSYADSPVMHSGNPKAVNEILLARYPWLTSMHQLRRCVPM